MPKKMDIKKILKDNPKVDRKKLKEASSLHDALQKLGLTRRGYRLHARSLRPADLDVDPRTAYLKANEAEAADLLDRSY